MRLLFLSHRLPYPPHKGEKIRALNILKHLAMRHEVHLGCLVDEAQDLAHLGALRPYARSIAYQRVLPLARKALALPALLGARSISVECFYSRALQRKLDDLIERERIEALLCSSSPMAEYLYRSRHAARLAGLPRVMDLIDVDSLKWHQYAQHSAPWVAWIYRHEARHLGAYERRIAASFDRVLVASVRERDCFPGPGCPANLTVMGNGVDLDYFSPQYRARQMPGGPSLVFTGVMDYRPNVDAMCWFAEQILPLIRRARPEVRLYIVGNRPSGAVRGLAKDTGIIVTGFVDDVRDYLANASICIAPLRIARGVQNKILEAMAMGRPVIASRGAFEGVQALPGRDLLVADDEAQFAAATVELLGDAGRREALGVSARRCVERAYSWQENLRVLDELFPPGNRQERMSA